MKSITIHNLDDRLAALIARKAREEGISMNKLIKGLLAQALGIAPQPEQNRKEAFMDLFGSWDQADLEEFQRNVQDFNEVDPKDWE